MTNRTKTYVNHKTRMMELTETPRKTKPCDGPFHTYPVKPGESITLNLIDGMVRKWRALA